MIPVLDERWRLEWLAGWLGEESAQRGMPKCVAFRFVTHWTMVTLRRKKAPTGF